jgi:hypothetical protein
MLALVLALPVLLNTYGTGWNALLKQVPVIRSSSSMVRWFLVYVPIAAVVSALALERVRGKPRALLSIVGVAAIIVVNFAQDRTHHENQTYRPGEVTRAHEALAGGAEIPPIRAVAVTVGQNGQAIVRQGDNDLLSQGLSPLLCYNPSFGYRLESLPVGDLHPGSVWETTDGHFNVKNPACHVFPRENGCSPGDHFLLAQREDVERFVTYRPFPFEVSAAQSVGNVVTGLGVVTSLLVLAAAGIRRILRSERVRVFG